MFLPGHSILLGEAPAVLDPHADWVATILHAQDMCKFTLAKDQGGKFTAWTLFYFWHEQKQLFLTTQLPTLKAEHEGNLFQNN